MQQGNFAVITFHPKSVRACSHKSVNVGQPRNHNIFKIGQLEMVLIVLSYLSVPRTSVNFIQTYMVQKFKAFG